MKALKTIILLNLIIFILSEFASAQGSTGNSGVEKRLALVIGNGKYINSMELANPVNDARAMKEALQKVGFDVYEYEDLNQSQIKKAIDDFGARLKQYPVGPLFLCRAWYTVKRIKLSYPGRCQYSI